MYFCESGVTLMGLNHTNHKILNAAGASTSHANMPPVHWHQPLQRVCECCRCKHQQCQHVFMSICVHAKTFIDICITLDDMHYPPPVASINIDYSKPVAGTSNLENDEAGGKHQQQPVPSTSVYIYIYTHIYEFLYSCMTGVTLNGRTSM